MTSNLKVSITQISATLVMIPGHRHVVVAVRDSRGWIVVSVIFYLYFIPNNRAYNFPAFFTRRRAGTPTVTLT